MLAVNYGLSIAFAIDPMEKKPLYHFYPGKKILSLGPNSCNLHCKFCQNYQISQEDSAHRYFSPENLQQYCKSTGIDAVAFTFSEPFTWFEYLMDTCKLLTESGIKTVLVTNGYINQEPLLELLPFIDAMNIDLKSFNDGFYQDICAGRLNPILETIKTAHKYCHIEVTTLLVTGMNDSDEEISALTGFLAGIDSEIPLHISRYFPRYLMNNAATPINKLKQAKQIALHSLSHVYLGNVAEAENTFCTNCAEVLIKRDGYKIEYLAKHDGTCPKCGKKLVGCFE
jgi:pyruvate formate lyase activating enzyme